MPHFLDKTQVSVAENPIHNFPKIQSHLTTANFMQFNVAQVMEIPKSSVTCKHKSFVRTMPLKRPLMGSISIKKSAFFVPYRTVWEPWTDFRTDVPHNQPNGTGIISNTPLISLNALVHLFRSADYSVEVTNPDWTSAGNHTYDFVSVPLSGNNQGQDTQFKLKPFGRWALKLFNSMGLRLPFADAGDDLTGNTVDALPFLAVAKVYLDYFYPNQFAHYGVYATIDGIFQRQVTYTLTGTEIDTILKAIYLVSYSPDYFVSAFESPVGPNTSVVSSDFQFTDISVTGNSAGRYRGVVLNSSNNNDYFTARVVGTDSSGNPSSTSGVFQFSQYMDNMLKALSNYLKRHQLTGSRALERYLADFGVALDADKLKRCYKLNDCVFPLQVGDVMATADTITKEGGAALGDYAGRAVAFDQDFSFDCDTKEDGLVVIVNTFIPDIAYTQGIQRFWFNKTKMDFLNGDFDGLFIRELQQRELFTGMKRKLSGTFFGFTPLNADKKISYDLVSGDFMIDSKNLGLQGFETARLFSDYYGDSPFNQAHSLDFCLGNDFDQYNRIFFDDDDDADKFIVIHRAEFEHRMAAVPLYDYYDFADNKKKLKMSVNGVKQN